MFSNSVIINSINRLIMYFRTWYPESVSSAILKLIWRKLCIGFSSSGIISFFRRDGYFVRMWENSFIYKLLEGLINLPSALHKVYLKAEAVLKESLIVRFVLLLADNLHIVISTFLFITLIVPYAKWTNYYGTYGTILIFLIYSVRLAKDGIKYRGLKYFNVFFVIFVLSVILSEVTSIFPKSFFSMRFLVFYLTWFLLMVMLVVSIRTKQELYTSIGVILLGLGVCGLYGAYQSVVGVPVIVSQVDTSLNEGTPGRVFSTMSNTNNYAQILCLLLPLCFAMFMNAKYAISKLFFAGIAIPAFISLLFTSSRSGWVGFAFGLMVFVFLINKKIIPLLIILGVISIPFMPDFVYRRIQTITNLSDTSIGYRFKIWKISGQMLQDYWITGIGLGTDAYRNTVQNYYLGDIKNAIPPHGHNLFLELWLETGIIGLLAFLGFIIRLCKESYSRIKASTDKQLRRILAACISAVTSLCVVGIFEYPWYDSRVMLFTWIVAGLAISALALMHKDGTADKVL